MKANILKHLPSLATLLILALVFVCNATGFQTESTEDFVVARVDVDKLAQSVTGRQLNAIWQQPFIAKQLATIPAELAFLKQASVHSVTIYSNGKDKNWPIIEIHADVDSSKLTQLIKNANQYTCVQFNQVDIHHWITDLESLGNQVMQESWESDSPDDSIYMAMPIADYYVISASLSGMTAAIERIEQGQPVSKDARFSQEFGKGKNLITWHSYASQGSYPREIKFVVREDSEGALNAMIKVPCFTDADRSTASGVNQVLNNSETAIALFQSIYSPQEIVEAKVDAEIEVNVVVSDELTTKTRPTSESTSEKRNNVSMTVSFDSYNFQQEGVGDFLSNFMGKSLKSSFEDDMLKIDARLFLGEPDVIYESRLDETKVSSKSNVNLLLLKLNAFSSAELRDRASRIANADAADSGETRKR